MQNEVEKTKIFKDISSHRTSTSIDKMISSIYSFVFQYL